MVETLKTILIVLLTALDIVQELRIRMLRKSKGENE